MPNNDAIQSFINIPNAVSEIDVVTNGLQGIKDLILSMPQVMSNYKGASDLQTMRQATDDLIAANQKLLDSQKNLSAEVEKSRQLSKQKYLEESASLDELIQKRMLLQNANKSFAKDEKENMELLKSKTITQDEYNKRLVEASAAIERNKARISELNGIIKENATQTAVGKTAYKQLTDQYNAAALAAKNYAITLGASNATTIAAVEHANKLGNQLKEVDSAVGQNQKNVGNYEGAMSKAFERVTNLSKIGARAITMLSRQIIGLGVGMLSFVIGAKAIEMVGDLIAKAWNNAHEAMNQYRLKLTILNDVIADGNKKAGEQITDLKILYKEATNVNESMDARLKAVLALKTEFPDYFSQVKTETILNGKAQSSYDALTESIIKSSRAKAAKDKLDDIERQRLDIDYQKEKINNAAANEKTRAKDETFTSSSGGGFGMGISNTETQSQTAGEARSIIETRRDKAIQEQEKKESYLKAQEDFLTQFVGADELAKVVEGENKAKFKKPKKPHEERDNIAAEYLKKDLEVLAKASVEEINILKDKYRQEADDQNKSLSDRYAAQALYNGAVLIGIEKEKQSSIDLLNEEIKQTKVRISHVKDAKSRADDLVALEKYRVDKIKEINRKGELESEKAEEDDFKKRVQLAQQHIAQMQALAERQFKDNRDIIDIDKDKKIGGLNSKLSAGGISDDVYAIERKKVEDQAAQDQIKLELNKDKSLLAIKTFFGFQDLDLQKKIHDQTVKYSDNELKVKMANEKRAHDEKIKLAEQAYGVATTLVDGSFTKSLNNIQDQIDASTKLKDTELERVNSSTLSEQDKAARIAQINAQAQAKQDQMEKHKREVQLQQAKFDRDAAILSIIAHAAAANQTFKDQAGIFGIPLALENDIEAALQVAMLLAKPLPKFEKGTDSAPGGLALTDEKGPEGYITPAGRMFLGNDTPTIRHLERGTKIIPHDEMNRMLMNAMMRNTVARFEEKDNGNERIENAVMWSAQEMIRQMKKQQTKTVVNVKVDGNWNAYIDKYVKN